MLAARQSTALSSMGNLAGPNGKPQPTQINRNVEPPKPLASPTTRVDTHGSETGVQALGVIGHSVSQSRGNRCGHSAERSTALSAARSEPAPRASASISETGRRPSRIRRPRSRPRRARPEGRTPDPRRFVGQAAPEGMREAPDPAETGLTAPAWVRSLIIAVLGGAFGFAGFTFWRSGRRPSRTSKAASRRDSLEARREPSFDGGAEYGCWSTRAARHPSFMTS